MGGFKMKQRSKSTFLTLIFLIGLIPAVSFSSSSNEADALKGLESIKAVIDFRTGNAKMAAVLLEEIHKTYKGKEIASVTKDPEFVFVFLGPCYCTKNFRDGKGRDRVRDLSFRCPDDECGSSNSFNRDQTSTKWNGLFNSVSS
jgi:hypothetical protein